jgi:hypothetical protein
VPVLRRSATPFHIVEGSNTYQVRLEFLGRGEIGFSCSCPYFDSNLDVCKHVWAAFLAADDDNLLPDWNSRKSPNLFPVDPENAEEDDVEEDDFLDEYDVEDEEEDDFSDDDEDDGEDYRSHSYSSKNALPERLAKKAERYRQRLRDKRSGATHATEAPTRPLKPATWRLHLAELHRQPPHHEPPPEWPPGKEILYFLRVAGDYSKEGVAIEIEARERKKNGDWGKPRACTISYQALPALPDTRDRRILQLLIGTPAYSTYGSPSSGFYPSGSALVEFLPEMCATGRCFFRSGDAQLELHPLEWDPGEPWEFQVKVRREESAYILSGALSRGDERAGLEEPAVLFRNGLLVLRGRIGRFAHGSAFDWVRLLRREKQIEVPARDREALFQELLRLPLLPIFELPEELRFEEVRAPGQPALKIRRSPNSWERGQLHADLSFEYAGFRISSDERAQGIADLPDKVEQTLYCELDDAQRRLYDELREHYRRQLLGKVEREGINKTSIQILEALLRLRQAAIHPGLIDPARAGESSAKLEALLPQLDEVLEEGHKVLVFSQFTSMLAILKQRLHEKKRAFAYLDGKTRDREAEVVRFQNDPECRLFLISLKAGGLGLNLTAAEYVFLLDPWWNLAVEMQAIGRSHRIGQSRTVFAYRLIARDTVEEKVLELQRTKRDLADAIINADNSLIRDLRPEDLALLLS